ncbi:transcriptional regulator ATRX-like [Anopheles cruzii]|uniref:transcriptional regulator ATRX-like n=1 Tax=Anopheles cruzii TaxID=68878 RepID=UPI0022EC43CC|nr:transcriptional regulator ATRX-like [Anopheles cruzii]
MEMQRFEDDTMEGDFFDEDGFKLHFEKDITPAEKRFYMRAFPNVSDIAEGKIHCTACGKHIGTAPIAEAIIRRHPIMKVVLCLTCYDFYNSGEFDKGEDGSELFCRWCGQGGEVFCCSKCPFVFCDKCIERNLSNLCVEDIEGNDHWICFVCAPSITWHVCAKYWAVTNYIAKQINIIKSKKLTDARVQKIMQTDHSKCCSKT